MQQIIKDAVIAAIYIFAAGSTVGCSLIGFAVGGAADEAKYVLDSVSVTKDTDSAGVEHRWRGNGRLTSLAKEASPSEGSIVEISTRKGFFMEDALIVDTVVAVQKDPTNSGRERLLPGDRANLMLRDSSSIRISGVVMRLNERNIVLRVGEDDRGYALKNVKAIFLGDERVLSGDDLASPNFSGRLIRVPGLALGHESSPLFIPLREVERIRVSRPVFRWGPARIFLVVIGGALDIWALWAFYRSESPRR